MTNEERQQAIEWLKRRPVMMAGAKRMYDLAVEALEAYVPDMNDGNMISRQAAIEVLRNRWLKTRNYDGIGEDIAEECEIYLKTLPSAQPERIKGHWIEITLRNHTYKCSVCGRLLANITDGKNNVAKNYPYCHCGADMRGERNECRNNS